MNSLSTFLELKYFIVFYAFNLLIQSAECMNFFDIFCKCYFIISMIVIDSISIDLFIFRAVHKHIYYTLYVRVSAVLNHTVCTCTTCVGAAHFECDVQTLIFSVCGAHFEMIFFNKNTVNPFSMEWAARTENTRVHASHYRCATPTQQLVVNKCTHRQCDFFSSVYFQVFGPFIYISCLCVCLKLHRMQMIVKKYRNILNQQGMQWSVFQ